MKRSTYSMLASGVLTVAAIIFGIIGCLCPPVGEVSDSMLILIAQFLVAGASYVGIQSLLLKNREYVENQLLEDSLGGSFGVPENSQKKARKRPTAQG